MEEKLLNEVENEESVDVNLEVGLNTNDEPEEINDMHTIACYDDEDENDEDDSENGVAKILVGGLLLGSFVLGSWAGPKIKKAGTKGFNWVKSKFSKEESEEIIVEDEEPKK